MGALSAEEVFRLVGQFGSGQKKFYGLFSLFHVFFSLSVMATTFIDYTPDWDCVDSVDHYHKLGTRQKNACEYFNDGLCFAKFYRPFETSVTEWDLICSRSMLARVPQILFFFGIMLGNIAFGYLGDQFGRCVILQWCTILLSIFTAASALCLVPWVYAVMRFFCGLFAQGMVLGYSLWMTELVGPEVRRAYQTYSNVCFTIGCLLLALMASVIPDWRVLMVIISIVIVSPVLLIKSVPESPSWLLTKGRTQDAKQAVVNIADANGVVLPPFELRKPVDSQNHVSRNVLFLFSSLSSSLYIVILVLCWFTVHFSYYGVIFSLTDHLDGNRYVNFVSSCLFEVPVYFVLISVTDKYSRRMTFSCLYLTSGVCLISSNLVPPALTSTMPYLASFVRVGLIILSRVILCGTLNVMYYSTEFFSPDLRNAVLGIVSFAAHFGGMLSPLVLVAHNHTEPLLFMGALAIVCGICVWKLPEARDRTPYNTLEEPMFSH